MAAEMDRSYVSLLETERYSASLDILDKLAAALKVTPMSLLGTSPRARRPKAAGSK